MKNNLQFTAVTLALAGMLVLAGNAQAAPTSVSAESSCNQAAGSGNGAAGTSAGDGIPCGINRIILASHDVTNGSSGLQLLRNADTTRGGHNSVVVDTRRVSEPKTLALMLAGLGVMGFIALRRMKQ